MRKRKSKNDQGKKKVYFSNTWTVFYNYNILSNNSQCTPKNIADTETLDVSSDTDLVGDISNFLSRQRSIFHTTDMATYIPQLNIDVMDTIKELLPALITEVLLS
mmetsp:Transcript_8495/g.12674  ORF Transcript_8495/g.12674 Transcript_8495/m.12674 type:complete len:105 (-) Transcript_8495:3465-3779(-)